MTETVEVKLTLPRSILAAAGVPERAIDALLRETLAVALYRQGRISLGKAAELAGAQTKLEMLATLPAVWDTAELHCRRRGSRLGNPAQTLAKHYPKHSLITPVQPNLLEFFV